MYIKSLAVTGLNGHPKTHFKFHRDINVITGINGAGKTRLMKLIWYTISANTERITSEIDFKEFELETTNYSVFLRNESGRLSWILTSGEKRWNGASTPIDDEDELNHRIADFNLSSVYFPTFRRIEGGYSMATPRVRRRSRFGELAEVIEEDEIHTEFHNIARRLSVRDNKFICSISTNDIIALLTTRYALISQVINENYQKFSTSIIENLKNARHELDANRDKASELLAKIQRNADEINQLREKLLQPFTSLTALSKSIFRHNGIKLKTVTIGEAANAIDSSFLSAGEKQMLSFLSYNAFHTNCPFFIDEPELSLHPDWQRRLFPTLLKQNSKNQFIIATHSPFIYSKYQDKELCLNIDRGE